MPRGDGTGPGGMGPMTGRAAGYCAGYGMPGYMNPYGGRMGGARFGYPGGGIPGTYTTPYYGWGGYPGYPGFYRGGGRPFGFGLGRGRRGRW
jgi:hypothetical protein